MSKICSSLVLLLLSLVPSLVLAQAAPTKAVPALEVDNSADDAAAILRRYATAWRGREEVPLDSAVTIGFRIGGPGGGEYHIVLPPDGPAQLGGGIPAGALTFETEIDFLRRLDRGEFNALTAMGQARASDPIPLVPHFPEGFEWTPESRSLFLALSFHFWNRAWPEIIPFGDGATREVHGANAAVLYYGQGVRTAWYQLEPGMHINPDPTDQTNPFSTLVVVTRGAITARLGGIDRTLPEGAAVFIPAGMSHEFWVGQDGYGEAVFVMFGGGA